MKEVLENLKNNPEKLKSMSENLLKLGKPNAAIEIATKILAELSAYDPYRK